MNPVIVIPSYWASADEPGELGELGTYDHATPYDKPLPELETCLDSLEQVRGVVRVVVLVVAPVAGQAAARARVMGICRRHPTLNPLVIGSPEASVIANTISEIVPDMDGETISLRGYGAIHNMGLAVAAILGHDVCVFLDDDEVALDDEFLIDAVYGLGQRTHQNLPILAKTGRYVTRSDSPYVPEDTVPWFDRHWSKHEWFNQAMRTALSTTRISRSSIACGGCMAIHARAFSEVAFDPWITRGEDLDYLINLRMAGLEMWFDNAWRVRHLPLPTASVPSRFLQDAYRWLFEAEKCAASAERPDVSKVTSSALKPFPGEWVSPKVEGRIRRTALLRAIGCREHGAYLRILFRGVGEAKAYAAARARKYFAFLGSWRRIMATLWQDARLSSLVVSMGTPAAPEPERELPWTAFSPVPEVGGDLS